MHVPVNQRGPLDQGPRDLLIGALGLGGIGILIWALVYAAQLVLVSGFMLVGAVLDASVDGLASNIFLSSIAGVFAGIAIATIRSLHRKPGNIEKSFVSALFSKGLAVPSLDGLFWAKVLLSAFVGLLVGAFSGADGFISFPQAIAGTAGKMFSSNDIALIHFLSGGFGGPGTVGFWSALLLIIVIILTTLIIGALSGLFVHLIIKGLAGAAKASTKELVLQSLEDPADGEDKGHPIGQGIIRGALTGVLVGLIEAVFTLWGIAVFYHSPVH